MQLRDFLKAGHTPTLFCAFLYFDISFMVWVLFGPLANLIVPDLKLSDYERGFLLAVPTLGGAILRLVLGAMTDHIGAWKTGVIGMILTALPLLLGWLVADSFLTLLAVGLMLGVAGASFAAALPLASRWYPPQYQGLAMGIAGAGNSGTAIATLIVPILAAWCGWHNVFGLALIPVFATLVIFMLLAKDSPTQPPPKRLAEYVGVLRHADTWWFCLFYSVTFGGFVGLATYLNSFFKQQYELGAVQAGYFATLCVISGSFLRPVGGYLADRLGGIRMLVVLYAGAGAMMLGLATIPPLWAGTMFMFLGMGMLGMGNGSVFQLVPQRFPKEIGVLTGIVGAAGGFGGFLLPILLGSSKGATGSFSTGFVIFGAVCLGSVGALLYVSRSWQQTFVGVGGRVAEAPVAPVVPAPAQVSVRPELETAPS